jgi:hypothetical protein
MERTLGIYSPNPLDATSFYRGFGPMGHLRRWMPHVFFRQLDKFSEPSLGFCDAVFMQRPFTAEHVNAAEMTRAEGLPLWIDYDDDLFSVPLSNPTNRIYSDPNRQRNVAKLVQIAEVVTVSTQALKEKLDPLREAASKETRLGARMPCLVIPNAINEQGFPRPQLFAERPQLVLWRGSSTHDEDLAAFTQAIALVMGKFPKWTFNFVGKPFWMTINKLPQDRLIVTPSMTTREYFQFLAAVQPAVMIAPLVKSPFNLAKSNIAWLEASWAGAACLAPCWPEWQRPGMVKYNSPSQFAAQLEDMLSGKIRVQEKAKESWSFIEENLQLCKTNKIRMGVVEWLMQEAERRGTHSRYAPT